MRAHESRIRKPVQELESGLELCLRQKLVPALDDDTTALGNRNDSLDATCKRARHDTVDVPIGQRPNETPRILTSR